MSFWKWFSLKFHTHEWAVIKEIPLRIFEDNHVGDTAHLRASGLRIVLQCKTCGELKYKDML
jgi:hypothetical protein